MLYDKELKNIHKKTDCLSCPYFDKREKKCAGGLGKKCFLYDPKTKTCIDTKTKLPIKFN